MVKFQHLSAELAQYPNKADEDDAGLSSLYIVSRVFSCSRSCFLRFAVPVLHFSFFCPMLKQERRSKRRLQNTDSVFLRIQVCANIQTKGARA